MTLVGGGVASLAEKIADVLEGADPHDDAPEFAVSYPFDIEPGWRATADVVRRLCDKKRLRSTREAVSVFEAVTGSAYATARALHALAPADYKREIRLDEVRFALASLPSECILPDAAPSVRKIVAALLETDGPLSGSTLADAAGVSSRSVRRHTETLSALDLVRETEAGYRVALPGMQARRSPRRSSGIGSRPPGIRWRPSRGWSSRMDGQYGRSVLKSILQSGLERSPIVRGWPRGRWLRCPRCGDNRGGTAAEIRRLHEARTYSQFSHGPPRVPVSEGYSSSGQSSGSRDSVPPILISDKLVFIRSHSAASICLS
jgi:biotin operon repressor